MRNTRVGLLFLGLVGIGLAPLSAQEMPSVGKDSVTVVAGAEYRAGPVFRFLFGNHYRDLWTTPLRVPVLDLKTFAGGLTPLKRGGGQQTKSLRLKGANGAQYAFRSLDKDPAKALPEGLRNTLVASVVQDQISSAHPGGPLVVAGLLDAVGVFHTTPVMVRMPNATDPGLREFKEFAGVLGTIEARPTTDDIDGLPGFEGADEVIDTPELFKAVDKNPFAPVDGRAFLSARLMDLYLGDWDRHKDQWRWARVTEGNVERYLPIPRDRDQAFVRFDGILLDLLRPTLPILLKFSENYADPEGAAHNGLDLDRRFLSELEWPVWDSVAKALQGKVTDAVIESAVRRLPPEYYAKNGATLTRVLKVRRDRWEDIARRFYDHLAGEVNVYGSDRADHASIVRDGAFVEVTMSAKPKGEKAMRPYFHRRFDGRETNDIRIFLKGGDDEAIARGGDLGPTVRFIGGPGDDRLIDSTGHAVRFYDSDGKNEAVGGVIDTKPYVTIADTNFKELPPRDWGELSKLQLLVSSGPDLGVVVGYAYALDHYGFRKEPYANRLGARLEYSTGARTFNAEVNGAWHAQNSRNEFTMSARFSGIEVLRFYGFGNETPAGQPREYYRVHERLYELEPAYAWGLSKASTLSLGPILRFTQTPLDDSVNSQRFIGQHPIYGTGNLGEVGAQGIFRYDTRPQATASRRGVYLEFGGSLLPGVLDVTRTFGELHAEARTYVGLGAESGPVLAFRAGAKKVFGHYPFQDAAFLGGSGSVRGFRSNRFSGDAAVYGSAELRFDVTPFFVLLPGELGLIGFGDMGRVFYGSESSDTWHTTAGAGITLSFLGRGNTVSILFASGGEDGVRKYLTFGYPF